MSTLQRSSRSLLTGTIVVSGWLYGHRPLPFTTQGWLAASPNAFGRRHRMTDDLLKQLRVIGPVDRTRIQQMLGTPEVSQTESWWSYKIGNAPLHFIPFEDTFIVRFDAEGTMIDCRVRPG